MVDILVQVGIPITANSIRASAGGSRVDPERVAPTQAVNQISWKDSRSADRSVVLGAYLYEYDFSFFDEQRLVERSANDEALGHPGFGYVVSHNKANTSSPLGKVNDATKVKTTVFSGGHHAIHHVELLYDRDKERGNSGIKIPVVIEWLVATGRDHPVWSVTWRMAQAENPKDIKFVDDPNPDKPDFMDVRGPYGSLSFDRTPGGVGGDIIGGVAWGDFGLKFTTTGPQLTLQSPWVYDIPNAVNFTQAWTANTNAEIGIVQTRVHDKEMGYPDRVVGRERGHTSAQNFPQKGECGDQRHYVMPCIWGWPYQLMNFDWEDPNKPLDEPTTNTLVGWGSPYGWLGASSFFVMDGSTAGGGGDRSYAMFIVLGPHYRFNIHSGEPHPEQGDVVITIKTVEALGAATISNVTAGSLVLEVPKGLGATEVKNILNGYNDNHAAYYLSAVGNQVGFTFNPANGQPVKNPLFVVQNYTARDLPNVSVDGVAITVNAGTKASEAFLSIDTTANELWLTLNRTVTVATDIRLS